MFHLHVSTQVALQIELAGAVRTLEGFATSMKVHVTQQVVHSVEGLPTHLQKPIQELLEVHDAQLFQAENTPVGFILAWKISSYPPCT